MTKNQQMIECQRHIEDGMGELAKSKDLCWQNELVFWLCKFALLMIEEALTLKELKYKVQFLVDRH